MTTNHNIAVFSAKPYDETALLAEGQAKNWNWSFYPAQLNIDTVALAQQANTVCVFVNDDLSENVIAALAAQGVKHIALRCAGFNNVDLGAAKQYGLAVTRVPAYAPAAVAEHAVALMLTLNRKTHKAYNRVRDGNFELNGLVGFTMHDKTVGIVGTGNIGSATVAILRGFGCRVLCVDPYPSESVIALGGNYVDLDTLLKESHIISLHCPLNEQSHHMINQQTLDKMRSGVMLINTSRGGLIDTRAVINALKKKQIGYLGLDVYEMESELFFRDHSMEIINDDVFERLATFPNVLITGHQGFFTEEALAEIAQTTVANINAINHHKDDFYGCLQAAN